MIPYERPHNIENALALRRDHPDWTVLAGGTDLLVQATHKPDPAGVLDVFGLEPLVGIEAQADRTISIGAATPYAHILEHDICQQELPMLVAAVREIGALQIQARGTIGGNIGTSSPVGDTLPVLLALDARIEVGSTTGRRTIPYDSFCTGYRQTALAADELILRVLVPPRPSESATLRQFWRKVGTRRAQSISKVMAAAAFTQDPDGVITHARIALGAVADRPVRALAAEAIALNGTPGPELAARVREAVAAAITPLDDVRSTASYRKTVAANLVARFITDLAGGT